MKNIFDCIIEYQELELYPQFKTGTITINNNISFQIKIINQIKIFYIHNIHVFKCMHFNPNVEGFKQRYMEQLDAPYFVSSVFDILINEMVNPIYIEQFVYDEV